MHPTRRRRPGGRDSDGRAERRDRKKPEDSAESPAQSQQRATDQRAGDAAKAAYGQHPGHTGIASERGIASRGEGVEAGEVILRKTKTRVAHMELGEMSSR